MSEESGQGYQGAPAAPPTPPPAEGRGAGNEKTWALFAHLSALSGFVGVPFGHILGPLIIWLVKKEEMPLVDDQGKEALNFQISMTIYGAIAAVLILLVVGIFLLLALAVLDIVLVIMATVAASKGEKYRYPLTIRFIK